MNRNNSLSIFHQYKMFSFVISSKMHVLFKMCIDFQDKFLWEYKFSDNHFNGT